MHGEAMARFPLLATDSIDLILHKSHEATTQDLVGVQEQGHQNIIIGQVKNPNVGNFEDANEQGQEQKDSNTAPFHLGNFEDAREHEEAEEANTMNQLAAAKSNTEVNELTTQTSGRNAEPKQGVTAKEEANAMNYQPAVAKSNKEANCRDTG